MSITRRWLCSLFSLAVVATAVGCGTTTLQSPGTPSKMATNAPTKADLRAELAAHRKLQVDRLLAYAAAGEFPQNLVSPQPIHMFKDQDGRLCAVANLVHQDGHDDLVDSTAKYHNDVVLGDEKDGPLVEWILGSGLTQEEIARIQAPAPMTVGQNGDFDDLPTDGPPRPLTVAEMSAELRTHFVQVAAQIEADTDASLETALARYESSDLASKPIAMGDV